MSFTYESLAFIDSYQIISGSLASHVEHLNPSDYKLVGEFCSKNGWSIDLLERKSVYPYEYKYREV